MTAQGPVPAAAAEMNRAVAQPDGVVYLVAPGSFAAREAGLDLIEALASCWRRRWFIALVTALFVVAGVAYALLATRWYRAEVVLMPVQDDPAARLLSQFGGIANLVGVNAGAANGAEPLAVLKSREFATDFVRRYELLPVLFPKKWDSQRKAWRGPEEEWPDVRDGVRYFERSIRHILPDRKSGTVTVSIDWKDPRLAAQWANSMARDINERMRRRAIAQAEANVAFLQKEIQATGVVSLQQPLGRLLETEMQKVMLARSTPEYSFTIVDAAVEPKRPHKPSRKLVVLAAFFVGFVLAVVVVIASQQLHLARASRIGREPIV